MNRTDSEALNRLATVINSNAHLISKDDVRELQSIYNELLTEFVSFENEVLLNEELMGQIAEIEHKLDRLG